MTKNDQHIKDLFSSKLKEAETAVPNHIWSGIESQLTASAATTAVVGKITWLKWIAVSTITLGAIVGGIFLFSDNSIDSVSSDKSEKKENSLPLKSNDSVVAPNEVLSDQSTPSEQLIEHKKKPTETAGYNASEEQLPSITGALPGVFSDTNPQEMGGPKVNPTSETAIMDQPAQKEPAAEEDRNIEGGFSKVEVDQESLRWFFFPKFEKGTSYEWDFGDGTTESGLSIGHTYSVQGDYTVKLTVKDSNGKEANSEQTIHAFKASKFNIVNAFSPGNNGKNDSVDFLNKSQNISRITHIIVLDMNGNKIFESLDSSVWTGDNSFGEPAPAGGYNYILEALDINNEVVKKAGSIQLFR